MFEGEGECVRVRERECVRVREGECVRERKECKGEERVLG